MIHRAAVGCGAIVIVAVAASMLYLRANGQPNAAASAPSVPGSGSAIPVQVMTPTRRTMERWVELPGSLMPDIAAALHAKASGYVAEVKVDIGDRVKSGDVLVRLDVPEMADEIKQSRAMLQTRRAELGAAQARVAQATLTAPRAQAEVRRAEAEADLRRTTAQRKEALFREQAIPQQELDEARAVFNVAEGALAVNRARLAELEPELQVLRASVAVAEGVVAAADASVARLETLARYADMTAPFDGVVIERLVDPGAFIRSAGDGGAMPVIRLASVDRLRVAVDVAEADVSFVQPGTGAELLLDGRPRRAAVTRTAASLRSDTRTMRAEIEIENQDGQLRPGQYVRVRLALVSHENALVIPAKAIRSSAGRMIVLVERDGVVSEAPVEVGYNDGASAEILAGLRGDEKVIVSAPSGVTAGALVRSVLAGSEAGGAK